MKNNYGIMKVLAAVLLCILVVGEARAQYSGCRNPNQRTGLCVHISLCPTLNSVLEKSSLTDSEKLFVQQSRCGNRKNNQIFVCCTRDKDFDRTVPIWDGNTNFVSRPPPILDNEPSNLLPDQDSCGGDIVSPKVLNGEEAVPSEFAWMVLLEYRPLNGGQLQTNCSGSLINRRYVLTAAHCLTGYHVRYIGTLVSVRLGEHDTRTAEDCQERKCYSEVVQMGIEEIHYHENYIDGDNYLNDIGLLRLEHKVSYSPTIRPICLPSTVGRVWMQAGQKLTVAGWGRTMQGNSSFTKQKVQLDLWDNDLCNRRYLSRYTTVELSQICAGGKKDIDSCEGDSGGPLMLFHRGVWVLQGIVSFGYLCGAENWPGVYTRVSSYDAWIKEKMRP
ncbi:serine protease 7-like [Drosophila rhopaloa]|uniref:CLIP domain-containing serine protease n=1 Tax=Drosophila rhopaloa TaxID=1041015 RepID=A0A6P4EMS4_DRORH|nr:serine protease 7-like [Drosophila rhopaloa]